MGAGDGAEHQDQDGQPEDGGRAVLQQLYAGIGRRQLGGSDSGADDDCHQKCCAEELGQEPAPQRLRSISSGKFRGVGHVRILTREDLSVKLDSMNIERIEERAAGYAALADVTRLAVVDELALGDRSPSELQAVVGLPSNLLAHHLKVLEDAGMVIRRRSEGDRRRTYLALADTTLIEIAAQYDVTVGRVVFVCSANSARSQLAAALWANSSDIPVASAGTHPADKVAEGTRAVAKRHSLTLFSSTPQRLTDIQDRDDFVIAVCDNAYEELGSSVSLHWSIPDPVARGDDTAFDDAYTELHRRITTIAPRLIAS